MFAPMEGITDEYYRITVQELYPEWDTYSCDFLRVPSTNPYPIQHIIKHLGKEVYKTPKYLSKTIYQILTSPNAYTQETVLAIDSLGIKWLDLNLGCPSKTVCKNQGGSFLLSDLTILRPIIKSIRKSFSGFFSCKIRVGYRDDQSFVQILKLLEEEGVDLIKVHARTRDQLYKGIANWDYIKQAVKSVKTPIIGNGDIWSVHDIQRFLDHTNAYGVMLARPALKTPWLAKLYKMNEEDSFTIRANELERYFTSFYQATLRQKNLVEASRIKRLKSVSRYIFDDLPDGAVYKKRFLLSKSWEEQAFILQEIKKRFASQLAP